jgi:Tol biopolymer transport system component
MSRFDDRLTTELERAGTPADPDGAFEEIDRRRGARAAMRRVQASVLATAVFAGSLGGVLVLNRAFRGDSTTTPANPITTTENGPIVVSFGDDGGTHLYLQDPDDPSWDPRDHQLTDPIQNWSGVVHRDTNPAVSPDGRTIVFERTIDDVGGSTTSIWTIGIDGGAPRQVSPDIIGGEPTWSPDGTRIAYHGSSMDSPGIHVVDADGSDDHGLGDGNDALVNATDPSWSPDGKRIAVAVPRGSDASEIASIDVKTGQTMTITPTAWDVESPAWSPDTERLTFAQGGGIAMVILADGSVTELTTVHTAEEAASGDLAYVDSHPTWSPDGRWIAFQRTFGPSETFTYAIRPDGSDVHRIGLGGDPAWAAAPSEISTTDVPPTRSPVPVEPTPGRDIGLAFDLCRLRPLPEIDFLGTGAAGTAWVGSRFARDGSCPPEHEGESVVAVDVDGDGVAESWAALANCVGCSPLSVTDLNGDGTQELVVTTVFGPTTGYTVFSLQPAPGDGPPVLEQVIVAEPGAPPFLRPDKPLTFWSGGDAGLSAWVRCEGYPHDPVLVLTQTNLIGGSGPDVRDVNVARVVLRADGRAEVVGSDSYTEPATDASDAFTGRACGLDLWPAA